jgi:hypothetical protein
MAWDLVKHRESFTFTLLIFFRVTWDTLKAHISFVTVTLLSLMLNVCDARCLSGKLLAAGSMSGVQFLAVEGIFFSSSSCPDQLWALQPPCPVGVGGKVTKVWK